MKKHKKLEYVVGCMIIRLGLDWEHYKNEMQSTYLTYLDI